MPKIKSLDDLRRVREQTQHDIATRTETGTTIIIGMGTCGIAAGARETMRAILNELAANKIEAHITTVGCIGMCVNEPLVDIEQAGQPRISYRNLTADKVPHLIQEHLLNGRVVEEWVLGRM